MKIFPVAGKRRNKQKWFIASIVLLLKFEFPNIISYKDKIP